MCTRRQFRALAFSVLLAFTLSSIPATAAPGRDDGGWDGDVSAVVKVVKRVMRFILHPLDTLDLPHP
jgi:hypothetical protein